MARTKLTEIYKSLNEQSWMDDEDDMLGDFDAQLKKDMAKAGYGKRDTNKIFKRGDDTKFAKDDDQAPSQGKPSSKEKLEHDIEVEGEKKKVTIETEVRQFEGHEELEGVTISWDDKSYTVDFDEKENTGGSMAYDEPDVYIFEAKSEDEEWIFNVNVLLDPNEDAHISIRIWDIEWNQLEILKNEENLNEGCTEQEIAEGTCGYAQDGEVDVYNTDQMSPAKPVAVVSLQERFQKLANISKK